MDKKQHWEHVYETKGRDQVSWFREHLDTSLKMIAGTGVIFAAVYLLWMVQRVFFGKVTNEKNKTLADLSWREIGLMIPLIILMVYMGVFPKPFLKRSEQAVKAIEARVMHQAGGTVEQAGKIAVEK